tara:strand:+ start:153 stop:356 length:204 start_codon:yes stop_codon:yes gene_type:complete
MIKVINTCNNETWINVNHIVKIVQHPNWGCTVVIGEGGVHLVYTYTAVFDVVRLVVAELRLIEGGEV